MAESIGFHMQFQNTSIFRAKSKMEKIIFDITLTQSHKLLSIGSPI